MLTKCYLSNEIQFTLTVSTSRIKCIRRIAGNHLFYAQFSFFASLKNMYKQPGSSDPTYNCNFLWHIDSLLREWRYIIFIFCDSAPTLPVLSPSLPGERSPGSGFLSESCCWSHATEPGNTWHLTGGHAQNFVFILEKMFFFWKTIFSALVFDTDFCGLLWLDILLCPRDARHTGESRGVISHKSRDIRDNHQWSPGLRDMGEAETGETAASLPRYRAGGSLVTRM